MARPLQSVLVLAALCLAAVATWYLVGRETDWRTTLESRFVYGVPWGTFVVLALVTSVYLFVQGGLWHWGDPLVLPFRAWSYLYPTGMVTASFAHSSSGHLIGNLIGTVVLAPLVEFAWGHYPGRGSGPEGAAGSGGVDQRDGVDAVATGGSRDSPGTGQRLDRSVLDGWIATPWIRAVVVFPAAVVGVGLLTSPFLLGPVIGFSGVVYAFGGFALLYYPVATLVALLASDVVRVAYLAVTDPVVRAGISGAPPSPPGWATIAVQGHALGILVGVVVGLALLATRGRRPDPGRVFLAVLVYATTRGLWAVYWYEGNGTYVLYRAVGVVLVVALALVVTAAATGEWREEIDLTAPTGGQAAFGTLLVVTSLVGGVAVAPNLGTVGADPVPGSGAVEVGDYAVTYEEDVPNGMIPAIDVPGLRDATDVRTSGVVVVSEHRSVWTTAVPRQYLASEGSATVPVGGLGWREVVRVERTGWVAAGNETVYAVDLVADDRRVRSFTSPPVRATPRIANHTTVLYATQEDFRIVVRNVSGAGEGDVTDVPLPAVGDATTVGPVTYETVVTDDRTALVARTDGTRVRIATREQYRDRTG